MQESTLHVFSWLSPRKEKKEKKKKRGKRKVLRAHNKRYTKHVFSHIMCWAALAEVFDQVCLYSACGV